MPTNAIELWTKFDEFILSDSEIKLSDNDVEGGGRGQKCDDPGHQIKELNKT